MLTTTPNGLDQIIDVFGNIDDSNFEKDNIVSFKFPYTMRYAGQIVKTGRCHKLLKENFEAVFERIKKEGLEYYANDYSGCYAKRSIRGFKSHASTHSWGVSVDLEVADNPLGLSEDKAPMNRGVIKIFKDAGFFWGGKFQKRPDPQHFQFAKNY